MEIDGGGAALQDCDLVPRLRRLDSPNVYVLCEQFNDIASGDGVLINDQSNQVLI